MKTNMDPKKANKSKNCNISRNMSRLATHLYTFPLTKGLEIKNFEKFSMKMLKKCSAKEWKFTHI